MSPVSTRPAVAPPLAVWMSSAAGAVLSTVTEKPVWSRLFPLLSVDVSVYAFAPAVRAAFAVSDALRNP